MCGASRMCFFSSRRRHTRLQGDWSSDVCSSDPLGLVLYEMFTGQRAFLTADRRVTPGATRSEERRVGKEGRFRWAPDSLKKKKNKEKSLVNRRHCNTYNPHACHSYLQR